MNAIVEVAVKTIKTKSIQTMLQGTKLPSNNPYGYKVVVDPIYEYKCITRDEMIGLPCRVIHLIKPRSVKIWEDDNLYAIYAPHVNKLVTFIREWLKCFAISNSSLLNRCAKNYLVSKGMTIKVWLNAIKEGWKGDILSLYGLCLLLDIHTVVHLYNGGIWTTLKRVPNDHDEVIS